MRLRGACFALTVLVVGCNGDAPVTPSKAPHPSEQGGGATPPSQGSDATRSARPTARAGLIDGRFISDGNVASAEGDAETGDLFVRIQRATADRDIAVCKASDETFEISYDADTEFAPSAVRSDRFPQSLVGSRVTITGTVDREQGTSDCAVSADRVEVGT